MSTSTVEHPRVVSSNEWLAARKELLAREKRFTRERDAINALRRPLPWVKVEKGYVFDSPNGEETLADLFTGRSQLIVRHFMFGPGWKEGCVSCSFASDHIGGALVHLEHHDITSVAVSRSMLPEIEAFNKRMGWNFKWVASFESDFNYDYHVSFTKKERALGKVYYNFELRDLSYPAEEMSGVSVFYKDPAGGIFHTYSCYARGDEGSLRAYDYVDLMLKGRNETGPTHTLADWVRHQDRYESGGHVVPSGPYVASAERADSSH
jgi:predicted dithiol-disulfide oxidoreductase (DUF899 family)